MYKLLSAEFIRLRKSFAFRLGLCFSAGLGSFIVLMRFMDVKQNAKIYAELGPEYKNADGLIFVGGIYLIFAAAVFIGIFVGTEYGDGTIRNKLAVGHKRRSIYLSKLAVCGTACLLMHLLYIIVCLIMGKLLLGGTTMQADEMLLFTAAGMTAMLAMAAILLLISMSVQNKAGSVICLLLTMILLFAALTIWQRLSAPKYHEEYAYLNEETGEVIKGEKEENPKYLSGTKRKIYEFLNDFLPVSQLYQIVLNDAGHLGRIMVYDCLIVLLTAGAGIVIFEKKDLK